MYEIYTDYSNNHCQRLTGKWNLEYRNPLI